MAKRFYDNSSSLVKKLISRNSKKLYQELKESKELVVLLSQSTVRDMTEEEIIMKIDKALENKVTTKSYYKKEDNCFFVFSVLPAPDSPTTPSTSPLARFFGLKSGSESRARIQLINSRVAGRLSTASSSRRR